MLGCWMTTTCPEGSASGNLAVANTTFNFFAEDRYQNGWDLAVSFYDSPLLLHILNSVLIM